MTFKTSKQRTRARVVQALYQYLVSGGEILQIEQQFLNQKSGKISKSFFSNLFINILKNRTELETLIEPLINHSIDKLGSVERAVLYLGIYELKYSAEVPYKVVINEALDLAKLYGAQGAYKLINTVMDKLARQLRTVEFGS